MHSSLLGSGISTHILVSISRGELGGPHTRPIAGKAILLPIPNPPACPWEGGCHVAITQTSLLAEASHECEPAAVPKVPTKPITIPHLIGGREGVQSCVGRGARALRQGRVPYQGWKGHVQDEPPPAGPAGAEFCFLALHYFSFPSPPPSYLLPGPAA